MRWKKNFPLVTAAEFMDLVGAARAEAHKLKPPFRVLHGGDDGIIFPAGSQALMDHHSEYMAEEKAAGRPAPVVMLPKGYRHDLLADWCSVEVMDDLAAWCAQALQAPAHAAAQEKLVVLGSTELQQELNQLEP